MALGGTAPYDFVDCQWTVHVKCQYDAAKRVRHSLKAQARDHALGKPPAALAAPQHGQSALAHSGHPPLQKPSRLHQLPSGPERRALAAWVTKRPVLARWCLPKVADSFYCL